MVANREFVLRSQAVIDVNDGHTKLARHLAAERHFVVEAADAPATTMVHHPERTARRWGLLRRIYPDGDFAPISHLHVIFSLVGLACVSGSSDYAYSYLAIFFLDAGDCLSHARGNVLLGILNETPQARDVWDHAEIWCLSNAFDELDSKLQRMARQTIGHGHAYLCVFCIGLCQRGPF